MTLEEKAKFIEESKEKNYLSGFLGIAGCVV